MMTYRHCWANVLIKDDFRFNLQCGAMHVPLTKCHTSPELVTLSYASLRFLILLDGLKGYIDGFCWQWHYREVSSYEGSLLTINCHGTLCLPVVFGSYLCWWYVNIPLFLPGSTI